METQYGQLPRCLALAHSSATTGCGWRLGAIEGTPLHHDLQDPEASEKHGQYRHKDAVIVGCIWLDMGKADDSSLER